MPCCSIFFVFTSVMFLCFCHVHYVCYVSVMFQLCFSYVSYVSIMFVMFLLCLLCFGYVSYVSFSYVSYVSVMLPVTVSVLQSRSQKVGALNRPPYFSPEKCPPPLRPKMLTKMSIYKGFLTCTIEGLCAAVARRRRFFYTVDLPY